MLLRTQPRPELGHHPGGSRGSEVASLLDAVMEGDLDSIIQPLVNEYQADQLAALQGNCWFLTLASVSGGDCG